MNKYDKRWRLKESKEAQIRCSVGQLISSVKNCGCGIRKIQDPIGLDLRDIDQLV